MCCCVLVIPTTINQMKTTVGMVDQAKVFSSVIRMSTAHLEMSSFIPMRDISLDEKVHDIHPESKNFTLTDPYKDSLVA